MSQTKTQRVQQRDAALATATRVRLHRAEVKRQLKRSDLRLRDALADPDCQTMAVLELLGALHRVGVGTSHRLLKRAEISPRLQVGQLTGRQRLALLAALDGRGRR